MLKQQFNLKLSQKLSPQQIQLMKLIQLPTQAFEQRLQQEIEENPALDTGKEKNENDADNEFSNENSEEYEANNDDADINIDEYLSDDEEFVAASQRKNVTLTDVRKARPKSEMHTFSGQIERVTCPRIAVLGTDCAIGKRTTATVLTRALNDYGLKAVMIGTGQTGLIQGAKYGVALDAVPSQFCAGELEATIVRAFDVEKPDVIIVEGQGALSHPAYSTTSFILRGSKPDGVILQHAPARKHRCDFAQMAMPDPAAEIHLIETFSDTRVIGLTINHEHMLEHEVNDACDYYQKQLGIPVTDALVHLPTYLVDMFLAAFPNLCVESLVKVH